MAPPDRPTPVAPFAGGRFELPIRAVRSALDALERLPVDATSEQVFLALRRFSAASGFLARELHCVDEAIRASEGFPPRR